ncbi:sigma-70 family RNA polymerase sigma factor [Roseateles sp. BYS180W]|uniref:Sigma-70 family RNA polymerase sigma factor n=1 Tax=Roseateles rivi TaxID=3299028 RepID=A0ABW7FXN1_9BURK
MLNQGSAALRSAFVGHREPLRRAALAIVGSPERADDVLQDAYLRLHGVSEATSVRQPLHFCFRVVRNLALDHWRKASFESDLMAAQEEAEHVPATQATPEQHAISRQLLALVDRVINNLPTRTQKAFELYHLSGLTQRDIGREMGVSTGLVNALLREASDALLLHHRGAGKA